MGIRCYCPNGHKLNLKSFLAGKTGVCPKCQVRFQIPEQSNPELERAKQQERAARPAAANGSKTAAPDPKPTTSVDAPTRDASDNELVWYVRPPAGGEYGPANAELFDSWLAEGRVTVDSFVWRTGWNDWARAGDALADKFQHLPAQQLSNVAESPSMPGSSPQLDDPLNVRVEVSESAAKSADPVELYRKKKSSKMSITVIVLLTLACAVLLAGLVWAIRFRG